MKSLLNILAVVLLLSINIVSCGNVENDFDASKSVKDLEVRKLLIEKLDSDNIRYILIGDEIKYSSNDKTIITKLSLDIQDVLYPLFNTLVIDNKEVTADISDLLTSNKIYHKIRIRLADFSHDKRVTSINGKLPLYYLVLDNPADVCKANSLIESDIGPFQIKTKEPCN